MAAPSAAAQLDILLPPLSCLQGYPYQDQYHFSVDEVRRWLAGGSPAKRQATAAAPAGEGGEPAAPALARRSARKPSKPSAGSRTPGTAARRRSPAAARLRAVAEGEEEEGEGEEAEQRQQGEAQQADREAEEEAEEHPQAAAAAAEGQQGQPLPRLRKRKASAVGASDEAGRQKRQEGEGGAAVEQGGAAEGTWFGALLFPSSSHECRLCSGACSHIDSLLHPVPLPCTPPPRSPPASSSHSHAGKAANLAKEALFSTTAVGVCYGLLRALYPEAP